MERKVSWRPFDGAQGKLAVARLRAAGAELRRGDCTDAQSGVCRELEMGVTFNYVPHAGQMAIHKARDIRFRVVCTGRRFGKTLCLAAELLDRGGSECGGDYGWVAPTYNVAERGIEAFRTIAEGFVHVAGRAPSRIEFSGPAGPVRIWFLSADNPDNIRGYGFQGLVIDEAASIPQDVWQYVLRPTISQTLGWAVFVSTPKGRNWFHDLHTRGLDEFETDYASFVFPSNASPYFPQSEWDDARRTLPEDVFRQEYMAEFLEDSAGVFRNVEDCLFTTEDTKSAKVRTAIIGCDVAKHTDFTVLIAMDAETGRCFAMDRFNHLDWPIQRERIVDFVRRYRGRLIMDATGVGDPVFDDLKRVCPDVEGFKLTQGSKVDLIQRLVVAIEQRRVSWPCDSGRRVSDAGAKEQPAFREENDIVISPHLLRYRKSRGYVSSGTSDALHLGQADDAVSSALRGSGQRNAACGSHMPQSGIRRSMCSDGGAGGDWATLTNELKRYEYVISPTGAISYNAPSGYHDDCVIALALANHGRWESEHAGRMFTVDGSRKMRAAIVRRQARVLVG